MRVAARGITMSMGTATAMLTMHTIMAMTTITVTITMTMGTTIDRGARLGTAAAARGADRTDAARVAGAAGGRLQLQRGARGGGRFGTRDRCRGRARLAVRPTASRPRPLRRAAGRRRARRLAAT